MEQQSWERAINWQLLIAYTRSNRAITKRTRAAGLTPGQPKILQYLESYNGCTQQEIARGCELDKSTVTGLLARMEANGLVTRETRAENRREASVLLTEKGAALAPLAHRNASEVDEIALRGLTAAERSELSRLLARVIENLSDEGSCA